MRNKIFFAQIGSDMVYKYITMLPHSFFEDKTLQVARKLLGKTLTRRLDGKHIRMTITETEAYVGPKDLACHTSHGRTKRNDPMYGPAGTIYVYFTYGMHWMLNIVTEGGKGTAILIRATEDVKGPARLTKALRIDKNLNGKMLGKKSGLWVEENPHSKRQAKGYKLIRTPRIGVTYAKEGWAEKPYRFVLKEK